MAKKTKIKRTNNHPEAQAKKIKQPVSKEEEFVNDLNGKVSKDMDNRESRNDKMLRWYKKRYGVRPATKTFPWPGASNVNVFLVDEKIRKMKPNYINLAFEGDPVVDFQAIGNTPLEMAQNAELFMDWLLRFYMNQAPGLNYFRALSLCVDRMLEQGKGFGKVIWDYQENNVTRVVDLRNVPKDIKEQLIDPLITDDQLRSLIAEFTELNLGIESDVKQIEKVIIQFREGKSTFIKYKVAQVIYNGPRVVPVADKDLVFPFFITSIQSSPRITHRIWKTEQELRMDEHTGKYSNVASVLENRNENSTSRPKTRANTSTIDTLDAIKQTREGVNELRADSELIELWETYTYFDIDGDGVDEKVVITRDPISDTVLRFIEFPYDHYKWPFIDFDFEYNDDRFFSQRGIPELLDHYQTITTVQENAKLDRMTLANTLQFKYKIGKVNPKNIRFIPGQGIPVHRMDDLQELQVSNIDISFDREMSKIRALAESYIGQPDLDIGAFGGGGEKTAFQVSEMVNLGKQIFSYDARLFKDSLHKMYDQIFELWVQYGPESVEIRITGDDGGLTTKSVTKSDLMGNFIIVPNADFSMLSRTMEQQRAFAILQQALADRSGATNQYAAWQNYLLKVDPRAAKRILNTKDQFETTQKRLADAQEQAVADKKEIAGRGKEPPKAGGGPGGSMVSQGGGSQIG